MISVFTLPRHFFVARAIMKEVFSDRRFGFILVALTASRLLAQPYSAPAGIRPAHQHSNASILPGGRVIQPLGDSFITGAGPFGLAISNSGKTLITANTGPGRNSLTLLELEKSGQWVVRHLLAHSRDDDRNGPDHD